MKVNSVEELIQNAKQLHYDGQGYHMTKNHDRAYMADFIQQEMENLNVFPPQCDRAKFKYYRDYLIKVGFRFRVLKIMKEELNVSITSTAFLHYFEHAFETGFVNNRIVEIAVSFFLKTADTQYFHQHLDREGSFYPQMFLHPEINELKFNINPPLLLGNEEKKKNTKKYWEPGFWPN